MANAQANNPSSTPAITGTAAAGPCSALRRTTSAVVAPGTIAPTTTASRKPPINDKLMRPPDLFDSNPADQLGDIVG
ncbi:hypothetical protein GCM10009608_52090 [Pseudonocardia alaniniphila]